MYLYSFLAFVLSAVSTGFALRFLIPLLHRRLLDKPNERSSHSTPTPSGGGVSFVIIAFLFSLIYFLFFPSLSSSNFLLYYAPILLLPLSIVGFLDDIFGLPSLFRYGIQVITALLLLLVSPLLGSNSTPLLSFFCLIAVTALINFTNFTDGMDGLVAGCMTFSISAAAFKLGAPLTIWVLIGSLLGFLVWNWSPARVFMGDVGSTFLGALFSALVLSSPSWTDALSILLLATPLFADALLCVFRRLFAGHNIFQAHRLHLFQRLHQSGWSHARVSFHYISATVLLSIASLLGGLLLVIALVFVVLSIGLWLDQKVAVPFANPQFD